MKSAQLTSDRDEQEKDGIILPVCSHGDVECRRASKDFLRMDPMFAYRAGLAAQRILARARIAKRPC